MKKNKKVIFGILGLLLPIALFIFGLSAFGNQGSNMTIFYIIAYIAIIFAYGMSVGKKTRAAYIKMLKETFWYYFGNKEEREAAYRASQEPIILEEDITPATKSFMWWLIVFFLGFIFLFFVLPLVVVLFNSNAFL